MKSLALVTLASIAPVVLAQHVNPYAGMERNEIKSLAPAEIASLLAGHGMGFARAAELNGYPGPMHVVELAEQLKLTAAQLQASRQLMNQHRERARQLGAELVEAERQLDALFAQKRAEAASVSAAAERVGLQQAKVRAEHLNTHLEQTALLTAEQIERYSELRGYQKETAQPHRHPQ